MTTKAEAGPECQTNISKRTTLVLVTTTVLLACTVAVGATTVSAQSEVVSEFDNGPEGWTATGDTQTGSVGWEATGGNPGGHVVADDSVAGGVWYWNASDSYLGDKSDFLNGSLEYDLNVSSTDSQFSDDDIILEGGGTTLVYDHGDESTHPGTDWTEYEVVLNASDNGWENETGGTPTRSEFDSVLSSLSSLEIRGEYRSGSDTGRLDNVFLGAEDSGPGVDDIQTSLSDEDGDGLDDRVEVDVNVSDAARTVIELGESNFEVDVSPTDDTQGSLFNEIDPDGDGPPEGVQIDEIGGASATYTVIADLSGQQDGETGTVDVTVDEGADTASETYTVEESTGPLNPNNPFGDATGDPVGVSNAADVLFEWNQNNGVVDGVDIALSDMADFLFEWNQARN